MTVVVFTKISFNFPFKVMYYKYVYIYAKHKCKYNKYFLGKYKYSLWVFKIQSKGLY